MRFLSLVLLCVTAGFAFPQVRAELPAKIKKTDAQTEGAPLPAGAKLRLGSSLYRINSTGNHSALTPDGKSVVIFAPNELKFLSVATGRETKSVRLKEQIQSGYGIQLNSTGDRLVVSAYNMATVLNPNSGEIVAKMFNRGGEEGLLGKRLANLNDGLVTMSGDGKRLAFGSRYARDEKEGVNAYVYDTEKGEIISEVKVIQSQYISAVLADDGKQLATFGQYYVRNTEENTAPVLQIWDVASKKEIAKIRTSSAVVLAAKFSPDGKTVYTGGQGGPVEAWDTTTGKSLRQFMTRSNLGQKLFVSADGKRLAATSSDGAVQVWDTATGKRLGIGFAPTTSVDSIALPADGPAIAFGKLHQTMQLWTVPGELLTPQEGHFGAVNSIQFSLDGKQIVTAGQDGRIVRWDASDGKELETYGSTLPNQAIATTTINRAFAGRIARPNRWATGWNVYNGNFAPDTKTMYVPGSSGGVAAIDLPSGSELFTMFFPNSLGASTSVKPSLSRDGRRVGAAGQYYDRNKYVHTAAAWDTETGQTIASMRKEVDNTKQYINGMATVISPDGAYFGVMTNIQDQQTGQAHMEFNTFDLNTGQKLATGGSTGRTIYSFFAASPDNRSAITFDQNSKLTVWDLPTGRQTRTLPNATNTGNFVPVFHPSGRVIALPAIASSDPVTGLSRYHLRIVEWASGEIREELAAVQAAPITALQFSPDGHSLAIGYQDSTVLVYDLNFKVSTPSTRSGEPEELWNKLTGKSGKEAWAAMRELTERPDVAMALIAQHVELSIAPTVPTEEQLKTLLSQLDAPVFAEREAALKTLRRSGKMIEKQLRATLETTPSVEVKERIERLLETIVKPVLPNATDARVVELLERIGRADAKAFLGKMANGDPASLATQDAVVSLARLEGKRNPATPK